MQQNEVTWFYSRRPNERISWHENSYQCHYPRHKTSHQSKPYLHTIYCFAKLPFRPAGPATPPPTDLSDPSTEPRKKKEEDGSIQETAETTEPTDPQKMGTDRGGRSGNDETDRP